MAFYTEVAAFFFKDIAKNKRYIGLASFFVTLLLISVILLFCHLKFPGLPYSEWVAKDNTTAEYNCRLYFFSLLLDCSSSQSFGYSITITHTEDKAIISVSQPQYYTMREGITAYKGYEYSDSNLKITVKDVSQTRGVDIHIVPLTSTYIYIVIIISILGIIIIYRVNKKMSERNQKTEKVTIKKKK